MNRSLVLLDGAMGTELAARGFELRAPLFSARALLDAPELVEQIHWEYLCAGAQILTTNSFGLHAASLAAAGIAEHQAELAGRSVEVLEHVRARALARDRALARFRIAGSIPPRARDGEPELARAEYRAYADHLIAAGVDLVLLETFTNVDDARLALEGLAGVELPVWLSVVAGHRAAPGMPRPDGTRLLDGDSFEDLAKLLNGQTHRVPDALLINCTQIDAIPAALDALIHATASVELPLGLSPHLGRRRHDGVWIDRIVEPEVFAGQIQAWMHARPRLIIAGGCCGSRPDYIAAMQRQLMPNEADRDRAFVRLAELLP